MTKRRIPHLKLEPRGDLDKQYKRGLKVGERMTEAGRKVAKDERMVRAGQKVAKKVHPVRMP